MNEFVPTLRPDSSDKFIWEEVFFQNEYNLSVFSPSDVVIDVGAHTGAFICACLARGARQLMAFEPDYGSFALAEKNIAAYQECRKIAPTIVLRNSAVWRSDRLESIEISNVRFSELANSFHFAAQSTLFKDWETYPVASIGLDIILQQFCRVALLKLDCEGAEWPILLTSIQLNRVDRLLLEIHSFSWKSYELGRHIPSPLSEEFGHHSLDDLKIHLQRFGLKSEREQIWRDILGNPEYYFGKAWFERSKPC